MKTPAHTHPIGMLSGKSVLRKWVLTNFLLKKPVLSLALFPLVYPLVFSRGDLFSGNDAAVLLIYFLGAISFASSVVSKKLDPLPLSRRQIYAYIAIPSLCVLALATSMVELIHYSNIPQASLWEHGRGLIRYTKDQDLSSEEYHLQLIVPPQLLRIAPSGETPMVQGPNFVDYPAPGLAVTGLGGPVLYNPYFVPAYEWTDINAEVLAFQLERALTELYGSSPSASEIRAMFIDETPRSGGATFESRQFANWQDEWAVLHQGEFQTMEEYWHQQILQLMPVRAFGWVLGWGLVAWVCFVLRAPFVNRLRHLIRYAALLTLLVGLYLGMFGLSLWGLGPIWTEGFSDRSRIFLDEVVRTYLPTNAALAWLTVGATLILVYQLTYLAYRNTEWAHMGQKQGRQQDQDRAWLEA